MYCNKGLSGANTILRNDVGDEEGAGCPNKGERCPVRRSKSKQLFLQSDCTNYFDAVTHDERRFQFRRGQSHVPSCSGFMGNSWVYR